VSTYTPTAEEIADALQRLTQFTDEYRKTSQHDSSASVFTLNEVHSWLGLEGDPDPSQVRRARAAIAAKMQWSREFTIADR
jgi:hypothetical protein